MARIEWIELLYKPNQLNGPAKWDCNGSKWELRISLHPTQGVGRKQLGCMCPWFITVRLFKTKGSSSPIAQRENNKLQGVSWLCRRCLMSPIWFKRDRGMKATPRMKPTHCRCLNPNTSTPMPIYISCCRLAKRVGPAHGLWVLFFNESNWAEFNLSWTRTRNKSSLV